jgi:DNA invertase Pin-like site-specific DNA recombinase
MRIDYARVSTTEQNLGLQPDDLKAAYDASVDQTEARNGNTGLRDRRLPRRNLEGA